MTQDQTPMLERVARALDKALAEARTGGAEYIGETKDLVVTIDAEMDLRVLAKAALEALMSPTAEMADAGWESKPLVDTQYGAEDACVIFQAMIRAALSSAEQTPDDGPGTPQPLKITAEISGPDGEVTDLKP